MRVAEKSKGREKARAPVQAAGGIVVRDAEKPLIAVVRLRKDNAWVLPKGKLKPGENALAAAKREVVEETGHEVEVHEFLGAMSREAGKLKIVQFWRMSALDAPPRKLMRDVRAVKWLPLEQAIKTLTHAHERAFLEHAGPSALEAAAQNASEPSTAATRRMQGTAVRVTFAERIHAWFRRMTQSRA
jgi:8-oxo-dGTP diphosphatase